MWCRNCNIELKDCQCPICGEITTEDNHIDVHAVFDTMPICPIVSETACAVRFQAFCVLRLVVFAVASIENLSPNYQKTSLPSARQGIIKRLGEKLDCLRKN